MLAKYWMVEPTSGTTKPINWDSIGRFLDDCDSLLDCLTLAMHVTSGLPARAPELATLKIRNSYAFSVFSRRNVFFLAQYNAIGLMPRYNKIGRRTIVRFIDGYVAEAFTIFMGLIRPVLAFFGCLADGRTTEEQCTEYFQSVSFQNHFFVSARGEEFDGPKIRQRFVKAYRRIYNVPLKFSEFRQVMKCFSIYSVDISFFITLLFCYYRSLHGCGTKLLE